MTVKELVKMDNGYEWIEAMREDGYEDMYQDVTSKINGVNEASFNEELEGQLFEIKENYENKLRYIFDSKVEMTQLQTESVELNSRSFNRFLKKLARKEFSLVEENYTLNSSLRFSAINNNGKYEYFMAKKDDRIELTEDEYDAILFTEEAEVEVSSIEILNVFKDSDIIIKRITDNENVYLYMVSPSKEFPNVIGKCAVDKELFAEKKEKPEKKENKTKKVKSVKVSKVEKAQISKDEIEDLENLDI